MKYIHHLLIFGAIVLLTSSCIKVHDEFDLASCLKVLDGWDISVSKLEGVIAQSDVFFVNEETGYTVGNGGIITKTTNGGQDWEIIEKFVPVPQGKYNSSLTSARLFSVFFVDEKIGFVGGEGEKNSQGDLGDAVLLITKDGGNTWKKKYLDGIGWVRQLKFLDKDNGFGVFTYHETYNITKSKLYYTRNGGEVWEPVPMLDSMRKIYHYQIDQNSFDVWGIDNSYQRKYLRSFDHWESWQELPLPTTEESYLIYPIAEGIGYLATHYKLYKTTDLGYTWTEVGQSPLADASLIHFSNPNDGFAIVPVIEHKTEGPDSWDELMAFDVYQTKDGGVTWGQTTINKKCDFTGVTFKLSDKLFYTIKGDVVNKFKQK